VARQAPAAGSELRARSEGDQRRCVPGFLSTVRRHRARVMDYALQVEPHPYDPQKAKQLLAEAGYPELRCRGDDAHSRVRHERRGGDELPERGGHPGEAAADGTRDVLRRGRKRSSAACSSSAPATLATRHLAWRRSSIRKAATRPAAIRTSTSCSSGRRASATRRSGRRSYIVSSSSRSTARCSRRSGTCAGCWAWGRAWRITRSTWSDVALSVVRGCANEGSVAVARADLPRRHVSRLGRVGLRWLAFTAIHGQIDSLPNQRRGFSSRAKSAAVRYRHVANTFAWWSSRLFRHRHRHAGNLDVDRAEVRATGEVERLPVVTAEGEVGGRGLAMDDAAELLPCGSRIQIPPDPPQ